MCNVKLAGNTLRQVAVLLRDSRPTLILLMTGVGLLLIVFVIVAPNGITGYIRDHLYRRRSGSGGAGP